jgi:very-short-patch-repair endonuclease
MVFYKQRYQTYKCVECDCNIDDIDVVKYSRSNFGMVLCRSCQFKFKNLKNSPTPEAIKLFDALKKRKVPAKIEKFDGFKTIDIAVPEARVNIEVDGKHHNTDLTQARSDLLRTIFSFKKGYVTLRIPNCLVEHKLEETANLITEFLSESRDQLDEDYY